MSQFRVSTGVAFAALVLAGGCSTPESKTSGPGGSAGTAGAGAAGGTAGTGGTGAVGGYGAYGGTGGLGGYAAIGGVGGYLDIDAGDTCPVGQQCGPTDPDGEGCGTLRLEAEREVITTPGNLLVIFDRSGSMRSDWGNAPRFEVAGNALRNALMPLQDSLTVGGVFFPSPAVVNSNCACGFANFTNWLPGGCCLGDSSCTVNAIDQADQISFRPGAQFIADLPNHWEGSGGTPLQQGVEQAAAALANAVYDGPMSVLIVTDGQPTCGSQDQPVITQVTAWEQQGIKTYVVGLPGSEGARNLLNQIAMVGGTMSYIDPANAADLQTRLETIVSSTVQSGFDSCSITLNPPAAVPDKLQLTVVENGMELEVQRNLGASGGWSISSNGVNVELIGVFCDNAQAGLYPELQFKFGCEDLPQLPPPMPPD